MVHHYLFIYLFTCSFICLFITVSFSYHIQLSSRERGRENVRQESILKQYSFCYLLISRFTSHLVGFPRERKGKLKVGTAWPTVAHSVFVKNIFKEMENNRRQRVRTKSHSQTFAYSHIRRFFSVTLM